MRINDGVKAISFSALMYVIFISVPPRTIACIIALLISRTVGSIVRQHLIFIQALAFAVFSPLIFFVVLIPLMLSFSLSKCVDSLAFAAVVVKSVLVTTSLIEGAK